MNSKQTAVRSSLRRHQANDKSNLNDYEAQMIAQNSDYVGNGGVEQEMTCAHRLYGIENGI